MLTLMLLRHAKAVQHMPGGDFARTLTDQGEADAAKLGLHLADLGWVPDFAFVSSSVRTRQTFATVTDRIGSVIASRVDENLYNATARELRDLLKVFDARQRKVMIVGHNPGIMDAAIAMTRDGDVVEIARMRGRFPPCSLAGLTFDTDDWLEARASGGRLDLFVRPEDLVAPR